MDEQLRKRLKYMPLGMLSRWLLALWLGLLGEGKIAADSSVNVPLQHSVYRYVERLEARGLINGIGDGVKPYSRKEIVDIVNLIHHNSRTTLSPIELSELALLRSEFLIVGKGDGKAVVGG